MRATERRKPENRQAPEGFHSCTSRHRIEVVAYKTFSALADYFLRDMPEEPQLVSIDRVENQQAWSQYQKNKHVWFQDVYRDQVERRRTGISSLALYPQYHGPGGYKTYLAERCVKSFVKRLLTPSS